MILPWLLNAKPLVRRTIALGLAALATIATLWLGAVAIDGLYAAKAAVEEKRATLGQLQAVIDLAAHMESVPAPARQSDREFLAGDSEAIVRGGLQARLNAIATSAGVNVISAGNAPPLDENGLKYVGLRANFSGGLEGIHAVLLDLETSLPVLFIHEASLRSTNPVDDSPSEQDIIAEITFYGALQKKMAAVGEAKP